MWDKQLACLPMVDVESQTKSTHDDFGRAHDDYRVCHNYFFVIFVIHGASFAIFPVPASVGNKTAAGRNQSEGAG